MQPNFLMHKTPRSERHYPTLEAQKGRETKEALRMRKERQKCRATKRDLEVCKGCSQTELCSIEGTQQWLNNE